MSSFAPPSKKARRSRSNGAAADSDGDFFPGCVQIENFPNMVNDLLSLALLQVQSVVMQGVSFP